MVWRHNWGYHIFGSPPIWEELQNPSFPTTPKSSKSDKFGATTENCGLLSYFKTKYEIHWCFIKFQNYIYSAKQRHVASPGRCNFTKFYQNHQILSKFYFLWVLGPHIDGKQETPCGSRKPKLNLLTITQNLTILNPKLEFFYRYDVRPSRAKTRAHQVSHYLKK